MLQRLLSKAIEKSEPFLKKVLDEKTAQTFVDNAYKSIKNTKFFEHVDKTLSFISGDLVERNVQRTRPEAALAIKHVINIPKQSQAYALVRLQKILGDASKDEINSATRISILQDAIREVSLGKQHFVLEEKIGDRTKTLKDILDEYNQLLESATPKTRQILREIKFASDEIADDKWFNFGGAESVHQKIDEMTKGISEESKKILDDVLKKTSEKIGVDYSLWNLYYPHFHINKWLDYEGKKILNTFYPSMVKDRKAFFEKPRSKTGSLIPVIDDGILIWKTLFYQAEYMRMYRKAIQNLVWSADLVSKLGKDGVLSPEVQKFIRNNAGDLGYIIKKENLPREIAEKLYPEEEGVFFWDISSLLSKSKASKSSIEDFLDNIIEYAGGKPVEGHNNRRIYLIPSSLYDVFRRLENYVSSDNFLRERVSFMTHFVDYWKRMATAWGRFVPFRLLNSIGDVYSLAMQQPTALKKLGDAADLVFNIIIHNRIPEKSYTKAMSTEELVRRLDESGIFQSILREFGGDVYNPVLDVSLKKYNSVVEESVVSGLTNGNIFKKTAEGIFGEGGAIEKISALLESTPKVASILDNLERVERGLLPDFTGATQYIKSLAKKNDDLLTAIFERGADITVDYSAIPPRFKSLFSNMLFPFAFWYVRTFSKLISMLGEKEGLKRWGAFYALPMILSYMWNTGTEERKKVWDSLPPYLKWTPLTIIAGVDEKNKKPIVFSLYTPANMVADVLGIDRIFETFDRVKSGRLSSMDAASYLVFGVATDIPKKLTTFFNPIAQGIIGAATNRDVFTGRQIVKDDIADTPEGLRKRTIYFAMNALMSPVVPMMMSAGYRDFDKLLTEFYGSDKKYNELFSFIKQFAYNWFDVRKGLGFVDMSDIDSGTYVYRGTLNYYNDLLKQRDSYMENAYRAYITGDIEEFNRRREEAYSGKLEFINGHYFDHYFELPSVIRRLRKDLYPNVENLSDDEKRHYQALLDMERINEIIDKETDKWLRPQVRDYYRELLESIDIE